MPLYIDFIDLTKAFDLVSRDGLFKVLPKIGCPPKLIRDMLFADDAAVATHTQEELLSLMDCFSQTCKNFGLTMSLKKTNVLGQDTYALPVISIHDYELDAVCKFTYLGSTITDNLSLDAEIDKRIGKAASTLARRMAPVWTSPKLYGGLYCLCYQHIAVWQRGMDYICRAGEWPNTFHLISIRRILGISWQDKVINADVLYRAGLPAMYTLLRQRRLTWVMSAVWMMVAFRNTPSMVNWHWGGEQPATLTFDIKMSA